MQSGQAKMLCLARFSIDKQFAEKSKTEINKNVDWDRDGLPLKTNFEERLSGSCMCQLKPREGKKDKRQRTKDKGQKTKDKSRVITFNELQLSIF